MIAAGRGAGSRAGDGAVARRPREPFFSRHAHRRNPSGIRGASGGGKRPPCAWASWVEGAAASLAARIAPAADGAERRGFASSRRRAGVEVDKPAASGQDARFTPLAKGIRWMITLAIIAVTCIVSFMALNNRRLMDDLILWPPAVQRRHEYHRLVTYGLVHADFGHLFFNMLTLFFFGRTMEGFFAARLGTLGFLLFYLGGLVASILPTYLKNRNNAGYRSLGASGAVSAALFAFILLAPWAKIYLYFALGIPAIVYAVLYVAYSIYMDRHGRDNVNHSAHLWGAAYGVLFTLLVYPQVLPYFLSQLLHPHF